MEDFEKKLSLDEQMEEDRRTDSSNTLSLLRQFLEIQQRRAEAYSKLKRGFDEYMTSGREISYQQLCSEITTEFSNCSKQVIDIESNFRNSDHNRLELANLLRSVQEQEKQKLHLTAQIQLLKKAGRPSERLVSHENCRINAPREHECVHVHEITEASGTEEAEADAEYDNALKEAIKGVQDAVTTINEHMEEVRYEIEALEDNFCEINQGQTDIGRRSRTLFQVYGIEELKLTRSSEKVPTLSLPYFTHLPSFYFYILNPIIHLNCK